MTVTATAARPTTRVASDSKPPRKTVTRLMRLLTAVCAIAIGVFSVAALLAYFGFATATDIPAAALLTTGIGGLVVAITIALAFSVALVTPPPVAPESEPKKIVAGFGNEYGLEAKEILKQSFEYARETAGQAMEHRLTLVNFFLLIVGGAGSGVVALLAANTDRTESLVGAVSLLWIVYLIGWLTVLKIIRLRAAWTESANEMNLIKQFFIVNAQVMAPEVLESAFFFKPKRIPAPQRRWNVFYYSALLVALLDASAFLGGFMLLGLHLQAPGYIAVIGGALAFVTLLAHMWVYEIILTPRSPKTSAPAPSSAALAASYQPTSFTPQSGQPNTVVSSEEKFHGKLINLRVDTVKLPSGKTAPREIVEHGPAVVIVAYLEDAAEFLFVTQYRDAIGQSLLEIPAGMVDATEGHEAAARRELREETGYEADSLRFLGQSYTSPGFTNELHYFYLATGLQRVSGIQDTDEIQALRRVGRAEARELIRSGQLTDGKSILGLLWAEQFLPTAV